jgi:hypothetical protein
MHLNDKDGVENALIRAQAAILNPDLDPADFLESGKRSIKQLRSANGSTVKFSPNVVHMDISGPGLPNLAFVDLPGIIEAPEDPEEEYLVPLIKNLVRSYLRNDDCLVLLAMPMSGDAVNNSAAMIARDLSKDNIIGVLTKPDMMPIGDFEQWEQILRGQAHKVAHGWFVTKQPSQDSLTKGVSHAKARELEKTFFDTTLPWNELFRTMRPRFGTHALQAFLSEQLGGLLKRKLPDIEQQIDFQKAALEEQLSLLPERPNGNIQNDLTRKFEDFGRALQRHFEGDDREPEYNSFMTKWIEKTKRLARVLQDMSPRIQNSGVSSGRGESIPFRSVEMGSPQPGISQRTPQSAMHPIVLDDDEDDHPVTTPTRKRKQPDMGGVNSADKRRRVGQNAASAPQCKSPKSGLCDNANMNKQMLRSTLLSAKSGQLLIALQ